MRKSFSVITNFGCFNDCPYCIWKENPKNKCGMAYSIEKLPYILEKYHFKKFSVSGGGDPLNITQEAGSFWKEVVDICKFYKVKVDIHTSFPEAIDAFIGLSSITRKIVVHVHPNKNLYRQLSRFFIENKYQARFNVVITNQVTKDFLETLEYVTPERYELAYRELVGYPLLAPTQEVLEFAKDLNFRRFNSRFVNQADYNTYLMPDGTITDTYLE